MRTARACSSWTLASILVLVFLMKAGSGEYGYAQFSPLMHGELDIKVTNPTDNMSVTISLEYSSRSFP